jgi:hypothetical protein
VIEQIGREPAGVEAAELTFADPLDITFPGFTLASFAMLRLLRMRPLLTTYQAHRPQFEAVVMNPFRLFRDDIVANWIVPSRLRFETERNVFSRIGKNDFGRGGANHRIWMAFYRPEQRRLTDVQLVFAISPDGFSVGTYCPDNKGSVVAGIRDILLRDEVKRYRPEIERTTEMAMNAGFTLDTTTSRGNERLARPSESCNVLRGARSWRMTRLIRRQEVESIGSDLIAVIIRDLSGLWPFHRLMLSLSETGGRS